MVEQASTRTGEQERTASGNGRHAAKRTPGSPAVSCSTDHLISRSGGPTMPFMFEKLKVYQKALHFADEVTVITAGFPQPSSQQLR
jgi:hypothetical protein